MTPRTVLLLAAAPVVLALSLLGALAWGLEAHGGPHADDPDVVAAHAAGQDRLDGTLDALLALAPGEVLDRRASEDCRRGRRAVGGLGVDDGFVLQCRAGRVVHVRGGALAGFPADAAALHAELVEAGWAPKEHALPSLVAAPAGGGGFDGRPGPADAAAAGYVAADETELSILVSERDEHPATPVDDGARGWETADRLAADEYGLVLRLAAVTVES